MTHSRSALAIGLAALLLIAGAAVFVSSRRVPTAPEIPDAGTPSDEGGRLMAPPDPGLSLYSSSANKFFLEYPSEIEPMEDRGEMARLGYLPVCDSERALVCFPYGKEKYAGTNFESAAFSVRLRDDLKTEKDCFAAHNGEVLVGAAAAGDIEGKSFSFGDAALSHRLDGVNDRFMHDGRCMELTRAVGTTTFEVYEPGSIKEFTAADRANVDAILAGMLRSFRFQERLELL